jgi:hypothetical protein
MLLQQQNVIVAPVGAGERLHEGAAAGIPAGRQERTRQLHLPWHQAQQDSTGEFVMVNPNPDQYRGARTFSSTPSTLAPSIARFHR